MSLPDGWAEVPLAEIATKVGSGATPKGGAENYAQAGVPLIRSMNVVFFGFKRAGLAYLDDAQAAALANVEVRADDVLLNITGASIGRVTVAPTWVDGARVNQHVCIVRTGGAIEPRLLAAYLSSPAMQTQIAGDHYGMTRQALTKAQILGFFVPVPPINEQQRIADKLNTLLARIDACRARLDQVSNFAEQLKQSVLSAARSGPLSVPWREANPGGGAWQQATLGEVARIGTGTTPLRSNPSFYAASGIAWVTSAATGLGTISAASEYLTPAAVAAHRLKVYPPGTLLVAMYGEGKTRGQVAELGINATVNQACAAIEVDESVMLRGFAKLMLQANYLAMRDLAEGGNQPNLNLAKVRGLSLPLPSLAEQAEICSRAERLLALARAMDKRVQMAGRQLQQMVGATLAKAFRGELVPQDPSDEPAQAMLDRLRAATSSSPGAAPKPRARRVAPAGPPPPDLAASASAFGCRRFTP